MVQKTIDAYVNKYLYILASEHSTIPPSVHLNIDIKTNVFKFRRVTVMGGSIVYRWSLDITGSKCVAWKITFDKAVSKYI